MAAPPPTARELARLVAAIARRIERLLERHGLALAASDDDGATDPLAEDAPALAALCAASVAGRSLLGRAPQARVARIGSDPDAYTPKAETPWHARHASFDLHAGRTVRADDRGGLERLAHYLLRPPLAQKRIELLPDGRVGLTLARPWADGTQALVFTPVEFLEKLAVLIPKAAGEFAALPWASCAARAPSCRGAGRAPRPGHARAADRHGHLGTACRSLDRPARASAGALVVLDPRGVADTASARRHRDRSPIGAVAEPAARAAAALFFMGRVAPAHFRD